MEPFSKEALMNGEFKNIEPFVQRMIKEYIDLDEKYQKLGTFFSIERYTRLTTEEQSDLLEQYHAMCIYRIVLARRLKRQGFSVDEC